MRKKWIELVPKIIGDLHNTNRLICPNCGEHEIDYLYIGISRRGLDFYKYGVINVSKAYILAEYWHHQKQSL